MNYLLAIDQGTSSTRAILFSEHGKIIAMSQYPLTQYYPKPGWVEHDPEEIWTKTITAIKDVCQEVDCRKVLACGITNQRETTLLWDKSTGRCVHPAIVWQDRRTREFCDSLSAYRNLIKNKTGLLVDPYFSATKLHWLLQHNPEAQRLQKEGKLAFGTIDSFLIWRLTNGKAHYTDITNASRTMLFDIHKQQWDDELLALFNIPRSILPDVRDNDACYGEIASEHLGVSIPITGVAGDQQAALIGQCCLSSGMTKATFGTGGFLLMNTGEKPVSSTHHLLTTIAYRIKGRMAYGLEGSLYHAGTTVKWLRDEMKMIATASETEELARTLAGNDGVYLVSSFNGLGAPHWCSTPGGVIFGLSRNTQPAHFARAALEGVCYQTREVLACMREDSNLDISLLRVDGGMTENQWFLQFLSSQCGTIIQRPANIESTALGAAMLAAIGYGLVESPEKMQSLWTCEREYCPSGDRETIDKDFQGWLDAMRMLKFR
ncbi:glycerol kinase GlpK [Legionella spiritensis]|uniref:Glycerol kinase n=1 Tax=Legionella spiritensis TaxID=452 RepID=A0A0W0Z479_LEGSP|nr:glycerol kinase GlpK [Legionella spiritensis]KTD63959.1 glycerol kinase [Legionella spiritensis]SNV36841.1 glycerol kinase [Legionella spiritensis]